MNKLRLIAAALICLLSQVSTAQPPGGPPPQLTPEKREKIEAMKVAFFTNKLHLTPDEAKVFWPVYNQFQDELMKLRENRRKEMREMMDDKANMSDKEYERIFDSEIAFRQSELDVMKKYQGELKKTLPMKKLARVFRLEDEFKRELLQRISDKDGKPGERRMQRK